ncbi:MAG TPA: hypothetical protein PL117_06200 [Accumulibacter sp.]|uniref:hypothetical protein n=1 Tax=Accumulibacter sp. TaxID=2053492 RepID=UPI000EBC9B07|nr:hypothetical protein [Accumulibacter sp.]HCZ15831.1 hypothetical protein [Accumulibacter sp.]HRD92276.1 hypothetical protein [Accumulibacter sp.]HRF72349.1 hypothetical protein [Accumulibacter sp.]
MAINITVITTANRARRFVQADGAAIEPIVDSLNRSSQLFAGKPLIIGSAAHTEVFSTASVACVEFETDGDLSDHMASPMNLVLTALSPQELTVPFEGVIEGEHFKVRIDFFFTGGYVLHTRAEGVRKAVLAERLMNLTSFLERPVMNYRLPQGGIGLMNPHAISRFLVTPGVADLPRDAWLAEPA